MPHRREYRSCQLCDKKILDEEGFSKLVRRCNAVFECDPLQKRGGKIIMKVIEWSTNPHLHGTKQIEHCRCKGYRSGHSHVLALVTCTPLTNRRWSERYTDQEYVIRRVSWSFLH